MPVPIKKKKPGAPRSTHRGSFKLAEHRAGREMLASLATAGALLVTAGCLARRPGLALAEFVYDAEAGGEDDKKPDDEEIEI